MKSHLLLIVASVAALGACNRAATNNSTAAAPAAGGTANSAAATTPAGAINVPQQLEIAAQAIQARSPMQQGPVTVTGAKVEGATLVYAMTMPVALDDNTINMMRQQLGQQLCQDSQFAPMARAGASFAYDITDSTGEVHRVTVPACPGS